MRKMEGHVYTKSDFVPVCRDLCAILRAEDSLTKTENRDVTKIGHRKIGSTGDS